jgi:predicted lipoprotein with Yx(FWY)xxD motif
MMKSKASKIIAVVAIVSAFIACSKDDNNKQNPTPAAKVQVSTNATLGKILTDSAGNTLYFFSLDASGSSACAGGCLAAWPAFYSADLTLGDTSLHKADFGTITRADGKMQTTYKGWPLYYYIKDTAAHVVLGDKVGNVWYVAKPDYTVMLANAQLVGNDGVSYTSDYVAGTGVTQYVTDAYGRTLYAFSPDKFNKNNYTDSAMTKNGAWPMYETDKFNFAPSLLAGSDFDTIHVYGHVQLTYKGWPLYYFGGDGMVRGNNKGVSVNSSSSIAPQP